MAKQQITGHTYKAMAYFDQDSIHKSTYLKKHLNQAGHYRQLPFFKYSPGLLKYSYSTPEDTTQYAAYTLIDQDSIPLAEIESIRIVEMIDFGYLLNIASGHQLSDTIWMKQPVVEMAFIGGYLCTFDVYVHENSSTVKQVFKEMDAFNKKNEKEFNDLEEELEYLNGKEREDLEQKIDDYQEELDEKASAILEKLNGEKVVIISFCSC